MTKALFKTALWSIAATTALSACEDTPNVGSSLVQDESEVVVATDFNITGRSIDNPRVQSRTITQVLGLINAKGYGNFTSDFMTQFMPSAKISSDIKSVEDIDSLKLLLFVTNGSIVGDSITPMGLEVYRLNKQLPQIIYSNENPANYYSPSDIISSKVYAVNAIGAPDSIQKLSYRTIEIPMPLSLAHELYNLYKTDPESYALPGKFAKHFPGIYVKNSFGSGRVTEVTSTIMRMYYHTTTTDSEGKEVKKPHEGNYYAVTPEIVVNNNLNYTISDELKNRINNGEDIIVAPVGRDIEIEFPVEKIIDYYHTNSGSLAVINSLSFEIPAEKITNDYNIQPPTNILMILSSKKDEFFKKGEITDNKTSFYALYDEKNKKYSFTNMRNYILDMLKKEEIKPEDYTFTITPVSVVTETNNNNYGSTSSYVSAINPYIGAPTMVKLNLEKTSVKFTFSKQTID